MRAAAGFKLHTGWAVAVAVANGTGGLRILARRRIELLPADGRIPRFVYHKAAELALPEAGELVSQAMAGSRIAAQTAIQELLDELRAAKVAIPVAGVPTGSTKLPGSLEPILASHSLIHAAEGALFQQAVVAACEAAGVSVFCSRERDIWKKLGDHAREQIGAIRASVGPPWGADQKLATAAALAALADWVRGPGNPARSRASARRDPLESGSAG